MLAFSLQCLVAFLAISVAETPGPSSAEKFTYVLEGPYPPFLLRRGGLEYHGFLDNRGNILVDLTITPHRPFVGGSDTIRPWRNNLSYEKQLAYEYRSGCLVRGELIANGDFVPQAGSEVISFWRDYRYTKGAMRIYNSPGRFKAKGEDAERRKVFERLKAQGIVTESFDEWGIDPVAWARPKPDVPPRRYGGSCTALLATLADSWLLAPLLEPASSAVGEARWTAGIAYEYREDLAPLVGWRYGRRFLLGHLDAAGNFVPSLGGDYSVGTPYLGLLFRRLNWPRVPEERVYEFRSRRLIPGVLEADGNFRPDLGGTIMAFGDYSFSDLAPRIYNLAGTFVPVSKGVEKSKRK